VNTAQAIDPLLPMMVRGRTLAANNAFRAKLISDHAVMQRRDPQGFTEIVMQHLQWAEAEAIARDRAGQELPMITDLASEREPRLLPSSQTQHEQE
jgi:hypothetical protein